MKKFIAAVTMIIAFTISANAQDSKMVPSSQNVVSFDTDAKADVAALSEKIVLTEDLKENFYKLMLMKYEKFSNPSLSQKEKDNYSAAYERKILSGVTPAQRQVLIDDPALLKRLSK